jgi:hypothetical protein
MVSNALFVRCLSVVSDGIYIYINKTYKTNDKSVMANCAYIVLPRSFKNTLRIY